MTADTKSLDERVAEALGRRSGPCNGGTHRYAGTPWRAVDGNHEGCPYCHFVCPRYGGDTRRHEIVPPPYSTDIAAAWLLVEEMRKRGWTGMELFIHHDEARWVCNFIRPDPQQSPDELFVQMQAYAEGGDSAAMAIALCALKTLNSTATHDLDPEP